MPASPARRAAFGALIRIAKTGSYADEMIHGPLFVDLSPQDRGLATEIVLGTLRQRGVIDALLSSAISRPLSKLDTEVLVALRMGAYQMRFLDRIPDRAAVSESVELIKRSPKRSASGLVNAALRKLPERSTPDLELRQALPAWIVERWQQAFGAEAANQMVLASTSHPASYLRVSPYVDAQSVVAQLSDEGVYAEVTELSTALQLISGRVEQTSCWREGIVRMQDLGAQYIAPMLALEPQHSFLDVCAAPGGKTAHAIALKGTSAGVVACDLYAHRLRTMRQLGAADTSLVVLNAENELPFGRQFDRVLIDAPCSGTGTLAHNPDIIWKLEPSDFATLAKLQQRILSNALSVVAPNGMAVYATCSVEPEENREVVDAVLVDRPGFKLGDRLERLPGRDAGDGFFAVQIIRG